MKFAFYYRVQPGANETKVGKGDAGSLDDARTLALNAIKAKYPAGVLLNVVEASQAIDPVDLDRVYAVFYSLPRGHSEIKAGQGGIRYGRVVADTREQAMELAKDALNAKYPGYHSLKIMLAKNCPVPVINAHGEDCCTSLVY